MLRNLVSYFSQYESEGRHPKKPLRESLARALHVSPAAISPPDMDSAAGVIYNNLKRFGAGQGIVASTYYGNLTQTHGKASDCLKCGKCEKRCPQHLPIRQYLEEAAGALER